jgi:hypothetical protein
MALLIAQDELRASIRKFANAQGATALLRHPDADVNDYINRALGSLYRRLTSAIPDQRFLSSTTITTTADVSTEALPADFFHLISIEIQISGRRHWLQSYEMNERPMLDNENQVAVGFPTSYRLRGDNIEFLPTPTDEYDILIWYTPTARQLSQDADTFDTISRLDDFIVAYASRAIAIKDKNWDLVSACKGIIDELGPEIDALGRSRDRNSPPRIVDVYGGDRWGRQSRRSR